MRVPSVAFHAFLFLVLITVALWPGAFALCPSNGNAHVVYVTSNMGDNIWSFDTTGRFIGNGLNKMSFPFPVEKLRDMKVGPGGHLYITSAQGINSRIFAVSGNGVLNNTLNRNCTRNYLFTVTLQSKEDPFLDHPYSMAFHPDTGDLYVSNQNSVTVTKYRKKDDRFIANGNANSNNKEAFPEWTPSQNVAFALPGGNGATGKVPPDVGLFASSWSSAYSMTSVRGLALSPLYPRALIENASPPGWYAMDDPKAVARYILVCDIAINQVHVFHAATGEHLFAISVPSPVQVLFPSREFVSADDSVALHFNMPHVYVTSKEEGMTYLVPFVAPQQTENTLDTPRAHPLYGITRRLPQHSSSGIFENPSHDMLLIADRSGRKVSSVVSPFLTNYETDPTPPPFLGNFVSNLPDQPEFILMTMVEQQKNIPFCYELNADGTFRYVALCAAAYIWTVVLIIFSLISVGLFISREMQNCHDVKYRRRNARRISEFTSSEEIPIIEGGTDPKAPAHVGYGTSAS